MARRVCGPVEALRGLGPHDHVCWPYDDREQFLADVGEFIAEGLQQRLRVLFVTDGPIEVLTQELSSVDGLDSALRKGALQFVSSEAAYPPGAVIKPEREEQLFSEATADALAAGFAGLRVVVDTTSLVSSEDQLDSFARWEYRADRLAEALPFSGVCGLNRRELGDEVITELACMHAGAPTGTRPFWIFPVGGADIALAGELDSWATPYLERALRRAELRLVADEVVVDGTQLDFVDHRALFCLRDYAAGLGRTAVLRTDSPMPARLIDVLEIEGIRCEAAG